MGFELTAGAGSGDFNKQREWNFMFFMGLGNARFARGMGQNSYLPHKLTKTNPQSSMAGQVSSSE